MSNEAGDMLMEAHSSVAPKSAAAAAEDVGDSRFQPPPKSAPSKPACEPGPWVVLTCVNVLV